MKLPGFQNITPSALVALMHAALRQNDGALKHLGSEPGPAAAISRSVLLGRLRAALECRANKRVQQVYKMLKGVGGLNRAEVTALLELNGLLGHGFSLRLHKLVLARAALLVVCCI